MRNPNPSSFMASPIPNCHQLFQSIPLFSIFATKNNNHSIGIRPAKPPFLRAISSSAISAPSIEQHTNTSSPIKQTTTDLNFEDRATRFRVKGLINKITTLSSSNSITEMLQTLEKDPEFQTLSDFNHLLMALVITRHHEICLRIFSKLPSLHLVPDCCTYSIMVMCHCERNDVDEARRALNTILENGFHPNVATFTVLINSLCIKGRVKKALEVFELMGKKGYKPNVQTYNCLLKGLSYVGKVEEALEMLTRMKESAQLESEPDVYSYTAVMDGLCKVGRSDEAMELLDEAVGKGLIPNVVTFNTLIQGYSREGRAMEGVNVLKLMKKHGCVPDCICYNTVLHGLLKWNKIKAALRVYKEMVTLGFKVDVRMMGTLVRRLCKRSSRANSLLQDADEVFEKMKERGGSVVDQRTLEVMVQTLCRGKRFDEALANLDDMVRLGYRPRAITFDRVIQGLCSRGRVEGAVSALLLLHENGRIPYRVSYNALIKELNAQGRLFCASYFFGAALKHGFVPSYVNVKCRETEFRL